MSSDLGFGKTNKLDISGFAPRPAEKTDIMKEQEAADRAAARAVFQNREPVQRIERVRKASEPLDQAFVRAPVDVINRFKQYCNETGFSYGEVLDELMRKAGI